MASEQKKEEYQEYVRQNSPKTNLPLQMAKAFVMGGIICCVGQFIVNMATDQFGIEKETAAGWCSMILILLSALLTGFNLYGKLVKWGGAGALVPITGFANSVVASAIEYKTEGQVYGIGCKIFTIAGPVILYGIVTSWALGLIYWLGKIMGLL
ncbi:MAG: SpoVA/SpoVAEb family sporulation membrane protein [Lachnospiraceae bacterium]|nr:SpoVA/SpoVAEb family sporulation membrane protein [Lachnospiraceae bacterium]